jgi:hypothetical protein
VSAGFAADMIVDPLQTARNGRAQIVDILTAATKRDAGTVNSVNKLVTKWNLTAIDASTFGFLSQRVGDNSVSCVSGTGNVTSVSGRFASGDVGKTIHIAGAGAGGATYVGSITTYVSSSAITVAPAVSTTVSATKTSAGGLAMWGWRATNIIDTSPLLSADGALSYSRDTTAGSSFLLNTVNVFNYGAIADGVTDNTAAFKAAAADLTPGSILDIPAGTYAFSSASLANPITIPCSNVTVRGAGMNQTVLKLTGSSVIVSFFHSDAKSYVEYKGINFYGNSASSGYANGIALSFVNTAATGPVRGYYVHDCAFDNFSGDFWVYCENTNLTGYPIFDIRVTDNVFRSYTGNSRNPTSVAVPQGCIGVIGGTIAGASNNDILISRNVGRCTHVKGLVAMQNQNAHFNISSNEAYGCGTDSAFSNDSGCYAFMVYSSVNYNPLDGVIDGNMVYLVRDDGFYLLDNVAVSVTNNVVTGQTSTADTSLPKAAIAVNGGARMTIANNVVDTAVVGIYFQGNRVSGPNDSTTISGNTVYNTSRYAMRVESSTYAWHGLLCNSNYLQGSAMGVAIDVNASSPVFNLKFDGNLIYAGTTAFNIASGNSTYNLSDVTISSNRFYSNGGLTTGVSAVNFSNTVVNVIGNDFNGSLGAGGSWLALGNVTKANVVGNVFRDVTQGTCLNSAGTQGTLQGNAFFNVPQVNTVSVNGASDWGRVKPTYTGSFGQIVQNLVPVEAGSASSKYVVVDWVYSGSWLDRRGLTGN